MAIEPLHSPRALPPELFGTKAANLQRLIELGVPVPPGFVLAAGSPVSVAEVEAVLAAIAAAGPGKPPGRVAVRSSATAEDSARHSFAGSFLSRLGDTTAEQVLESIELVRTSPATRSAVVIKSAVVIQSLVEPEISGAAVSTNPLTLRRSEAVISFVRGMGAALMAGQVPGETVVVDLAAASVPPSLEAYSAQIGELLKILALVDADWRAPVEIEWCIDQKDGRLWIVQARPIVLPVATEVELTSEDSFDRLGPLVREHPKLVLRRAMMAAGVPMSRAAVVVRTGVDEGPSPIRFRPSPTAAGLSVVLLSPATVDGAVVRDFAPALGEDVPFYVNECRRYSIRRYPGAADLDATVAAATDVGLSLAWAASCLVQEIYAADYTGILRQVSDGYLVEAALGHFVPKGIVTTSAFFFDRDGRLTGTRRVVQPTAYHFMDGHVVLEDPNEEVLAATEQEIVAVLRQLRPALTESGGEALEFGVVRSDGEAMAYVIDIAESDTAGNALSVSAASAGVVSPGRASGQIVPIRLLDASGALDLHLLDEQERTAEVTSGIFLAPHPSVTLLPLIYRAGPGSAFVFRYASVLSHVSVVLREVGIPAVAVGDRCYEALLAASGTVEVDATSPDKSGAERVTPR
jgi:hypothetical protein